MPTYKSASASVKLSVADLDLSTTQSPIGPPGKEQTALLHSIARELKKGLKERPLAEIPIYTDELFPSHLRFLGPQNDMPFLLVHAGLDLSVSSSLKGNDTRLSSFSLPALTGYETNSVGSKRPTSGFPSFSTSQDVERESENVVVQAPEWGLSDTGELIQVPLPESYTSLFSKNLESLDHMFVDDMFGASSTTFAAHSAFTPYGYPDASTGRSFVPARAHTEYEQNMKPQALCLTVQLSKESFLCQSIHNSKKLMVLDVKIDVYFNGELCASAYVPERMRSDSNISELTQRFSGRRIERLLERPWMIAPTFQHADGTLRERTRSLGDYGGAQQRWTAISELLMGEAEMGGRDEWGELTVLGKYLESLANVPMPREAENIENAGGLHFGIIDVVLTAGCGKKDDPDVGYLSAPTRMRIERPRPGFAGKASGSKMKARPKISADAEIVASGFISSLAPRHASAVLKSHVSESTPFSFSGRSAPIGCSMFQAPGALLGASLNQLMAKDKTLPLGFEPASADAKLGTAHHLTTPDTYPEVFALQEHSSFSAPAYNGLHTGTADNMASASSMEPRPLKRRKWNNPGSTGDKREYLKTQNQNYRGRVRGPGGFFIKTPPHLKGAPVLDRATQRNIHRPKNIPQKRYKGAEAEKGDEKPQEKLRTGMAYELVANIKPTVAEQIKATEDLAKELASHYHGDPFSPPKTRGRGNRPSTRPAQELLPTAPVQLSVAPAELSIESSRLPIAPCHSEKVLTGPLPTVAPVSQPLCIYRKILCFRLPREKLVMLSSRPRTPPLELDYQTTQSFSPLSELSNTPKSKFSTPAHNTSHAADNNNVYSATPSAKPKAPRKYKPINKAKYAPIGTAPVTWEPSSLNNDCVITYADGKVRQVKSERTGWFKESSILMGVRFLVG